MRCLDSITNSTDMSLSTLQEREKDRGTWCAEVHGVVKNRTQLSETDQQLTMLPSHTHHLPNLWQPQICPPFL